jgi:chemotaxis protein MotB
VSGRKSVPLDPRPRGRSRAGSSNKDRWIVSYADFMTLLFAFFTTMYAVSTVDASKLSSVAAGLHEAFDRPSGPALTGAPLAAPGVLPTGRGIVGPGDGAGAGPASSPDVRAEIERALADDIATHRLQLTEDRRGLVLSIPETGAFPAGSAELSAAAEQVMTRLSIALQRLPNGVRIEGHTDDAPIHNARYTSNWELSTARATHVVQFLIQQGGLAPDRLSAAGYGPFHPVADNGSPDGRARNRRVDVIVLNAATHRAEEPVSEDAAR